MNKLFYERLAKKREVAGLSVYRLAQLSGVTASTIYNIEKGEAVPCAETCALLLENLGVKFNGRKLSQYLEKKEKTLNMSLQKLARSVNVGYGTLYKIKQGYIPSTKLCCVVAKELNLPLEDLIDWDDDNRNGK